MRDEGKKGENLKHSRIETKLREWSLRPDSRIAVAKKSSDGKDIDRVADKEGAPVLSSRESGPRIQETMPSFHDRLFKKFPQCRMESIPLGRVAELGDASPNLPLFILSPCGSDENGLKVWASGDMIEFAAACSWDAVAGSILHIFAGWPAVELLTYSVATSIPS